MSRVGCRTGARGKSVGPEERRGRGSWEWRQTVRGKRSQDRVQRGDRGRADLVRMREMPGMEASWTRAGRRGRGRGVSLEDESGAEVRTAANRASPVPGMGSCRTRDGTLLHRIWFNIKTSAGSRAMMLTFERARGLDQPVHQLISQRVVRASDRSRLPTSWSLRRPHRPCPSSSPVRRRTRPLP